MLIIIIIEKFILAILLRIIITYFRNPKYIKNKEYLESHFNKLPSLKDDDQNEKIKQPNTPTKTKRSFGPSRNTSNIGSARGSVRGSDF